jgi:hypothetical protein
MEITTKEQLIQAIHATEGNYSSVWVRFGPGSIKGKLVSPEDRELYLDELPLKDLESPAAESGGSEPLG